MIKSKSDLEYFLKQDQKALGIKYVSYLSRLILLFKFEYIPIFQYHLRQAEYYYNKRSGVLGMLQYTFHVYRYRKYGLKCGFSIPINVFGAGLAIVHRGTIIVNHEARVGKNCRIHPGLNIGASGGVAGAPDIGDNVYFAPGVKIYGRIRVSDNIAFAANAAISKDCLEPNSMYGGVPAKRIGSCDISRIIKHIKTEP